MFSYKKGLFSDRPKPRILRSGGSTLGSIGVGIPPFEFPIFSIYTKIRFCRFFFCNFSVPIFKEVIPVFATKVQLYMIILKTISG